MGVRNLLSSTTTLELGIDIGGLNAVLMANLPPGKANYLQRAGRAGRRADGSAAVVSFTRPNPYEQAVFRDFGHFLKSDLRKPTVFLDRERVIIRHWNASLLGEFFRQWLPKNKSVGAMRAYGTMGKFCNAPEIPYWEKNRNKPDIQKTGTSENIAKQFLAFLREEAEKTDLSRYENVRRKLREGTPKDVLSNDTRSLLLSAADAFEKAINGWKEDYEKLLKGWKSITPETGGSAAANSLYYQLNILHDLTVIEELADRQVLPRYGFPIGLSKLHVKVVDEKRGTIREEDQFRLERAGIQALREYVPGSRLIVGNRVIVSRGLCKHWTGNNANEGFGLRKQLVTCAREHKFYQDTEKTNCPLCDAKKKSEQWLLFPRNGFTTAAWEPPKYGSDIDVIGQAICQTFAFRDSSNDSENKIERVENFAGIQKLHAEWRQFAEILVSNAGENGHGFAICTQCGYAESEKELGRGRDKLPRGFENHASLFSKIQKSHCWKDETSAPVIRNQVLAARQNTDILLLDFSEWLKFGEQKHHPIQKALATALRLSGARLLELDSREIGAMTDVPTGQKGEGLGIAIYDNTPGGSGHVRELLKIGRPWLEAAQQLLFGSEEHNKSCEHGCLDCILSYGLEDNANPILPNRRIACECLSNLLESATWAPPTTAETQEPQESSIQAPVAPSNDLRKLKRKLEQKQRGASPSPKRNITRWLQKITNNELNSEEIEEIKQFLAE